MYESQVAEYKYEIERLSRDLHDAKKKYFMQRKKEQHAKYVTLIAYISMLFTLLFTVRLFADAELTII